MLTICSALKSELMPIAGSFPLLKKQTIAGGGSLYLSEHMHFLRTGVGQTAGSVLQAYLKQFQPAAVWNAGLAGALHRQFHPAQIFQITHVQSLTSTNSFVLPEQEALPELPVARLVTALQAVTNTEERDRLRAQTSADLVDMEAFYLAEQCRTRDIPFTAFKMVSDYADTQTEKDFLQHLHTYSQRLAQALYPLLLKHVA